MREKEANARIAARRLRASMTDAEVILWSVLRHRTFGWRFRRQHPVGPFIADFACIAAQLVIEVDGATHGPDAAERDARRTSFFQSLGWRVLRVQNAEVYTDLDGVCRRLLAELGAPPKEKLQ
jgi:very-short-patch-repair endonuclease